jgi:hypothetical protein
VCVNGYEMIFAKIDIPVRTIKKLPVLNFTRANLLVEACLGTASEVATVILVAKLITRCLRRRLALLITPVTSAIRAR